MEVLEVLDLDVFLIEHQAQQLPCLNTNEYFNILLSF
jgi:hypothetical protein